MTESFDRYHDRYDEEMACALRGMPGKHASFIRAKALILEALSLRFRGGTGKMRLLDVGCGTGLVEQALSIPEAEITGLDVSEPLLEKARRNVPGCRFLAFDGRRIDNENNSYHIVFAINTFHHVPVGQRLGLLGEMWRVLLPGGVLALFEHNPWHPVTRFVVSRCGFDRHAELLCRSDALSLLRNTGLHHLEASYIIFIPWGTGVNRLLERFLGWLPLGVQYYVAGVK
jgi:SAM-dependent methyltransferase